MLLRGRWIRRLTFLVVRQQSMPAYFTFRERLDYQEDPVIRYGERFAIPALCANHGLRCDGMAPTGCVWRRSGGRALPHCLDDRHVEPAMAFQLELFRMSGFDVKASVLESRSLHLYYGMLSTVPPAGRRPLRPDGRGHHAGGALMTVPCGWDGVAGMGAYL